MRDNILEYVKRELIGPDPIEPHVQENGEEILINEPPRLRYGAGVLFPKASTIEEIDSTSPDEDQLLDTTEEGENETDDPVQTTDKDTPADVGEDFEEEIGLANSLLPSALGFSCFSKVPTEGYKVDIKAAVYELRDYTYKKNDGQT